MKIIKKDNGYYAVYLRGDKHPLSLKTGSKEEALRLVKEAGLEQLEHLRKVNALTTDAIARVMASRKTPFSLVFPEWETWADSIGLGKATIRSYSLHLLDWAQRTGRNFEPLSATQPSHLDEFLNAKDGVKLGTRGVRLNALKHFFGYCSAKGYILGNPAQLVQVKVNELTFAQKEPKVRAIFTEEEIGRLRYYLTVTPEVSNFWYVAVVLSLEFGLRLSDCCLISKEQFANGKLIVWMEKTHTRLEMPDRGLGELVPYGGFADIAARYKNLDLRATLSSEFTNILRKAGIHGRSFHCLRHTFATRHRALGVSVDEIRLKLGHTSTATTEGYIHT